MELVTTNWPPITTGAGETGSQMEAEPRFVAETSTKLVAFAGQEKIKLPLCLTARSGGESGL